MPLAGQLVHQRSVNPGPLVLRVAPFKSPTPTRDRDRTVSRRSKPSSRTALTGEQPDPWDLLLPQDAMSRHRDYIPAFARGQTIAPSAKGLWRSRRVITSLALHLPGDLTLSGSVVTGS